MRSIRNLEDAKIVLKELCDWKDKLSSKDWDFAGLRIRNASPSLDDNDYVVRKELPVLPDFNPDKNKYYTIIFTTPGDIEVGNDVCGPDIISRWGEGYVVEILISAVEVTSLVTAEVTLNSVSIGNTAISLRPDDVVASFVTFNAPSVHFKYKDRVNVNILGGVASKLSICVRVKKTV